MNAFITRSSTQHRHKDQSSDAYKGLLAAPTLRTSPDHSSPQNNTTIIKETKRTYYSLVTTMQCLTPNSASKITRHYYYFITLPGEGSCPFQKT